MRRDLMNIFILVSIMILFSNCSKKEEQEVEQVAVRTEQTQEVINKIADEFIELPFEEAKMPTQITNYKGSIESGKYWKDKNGDNYFILTFEPYTYKEIEDGEGGQSRIGHGYHFCNNNTNDFTLVIDFFDVVKDCQADIAFGFLPEYFTLQDLNNNRYGEISVIYNMYCGWDHSSHTLKLFMFENGEKYAISGETRINYDGGGYGGELIVEKSFINVENTLRNYAVTQFQKAAGIKK